MATLLPLQIFISLGVVLSIALIALVFDLLRGNNAQLRKRLDVLTVELAEHKEKEQKRSTGAALPRRRARAAQQTDNPSSPSRSNIATMPVRDAVRPAVARVTTVFELKRVANGSPVYAVEPGPRSEPTPRNSPVGSWDLVDPIVRKRMKELDDADLNRVAEEARANAINSIADKKALERLLAADESVSGVVVSLSTGEATHGMQSMIDFVGSLVDENCFVCQSGDHEFLLVHPTENSAAAQRKLNQISEKLWNFQLQSFASSPVMFSWGGLEVRQEPISEAISSARERMYQTQRLRSSASLGFSERHSHSTA